VATIARVTSLRRLAPLVLVPLLAFSAGCGGDSNTPKAESTQCTYTKGGPPASKKVDPPAGDPDKNAPEAVTISTNQGDIKVGLDADKAPCTVNSFLSLAKQGYFDNTKCHRLKSDGLFVLQCGDPSGTGQGGPGYVFADELVDDDPRLQPCLGQVDQTTQKEYCTYTTGTVAMANSLRPSTNGSQFFLVYQDTTLPAAYTVFGHMSAAGVKVVQKVAKGGNIPGTEQPAIPVTIASVK
jgi:peptidyl-prolyl cis-trans isomerase B (cyclophilin B)